MTFPLDPAAPVPPDGENPIRDMNPYRYEGANLVRRVCKQLDSANDMVERDGETPQNRRDLEAREDWRAARVDAINRGDLSFDRGFISGLAAGRAAATPDPPDEEATDG